MRKGSNHALIDIQKSSDKNWHIQLSQKIAVTPGKTYGIDVELDAYWHKDVTLIIQDSVKPYTVRFRKELKVKNDDDGRTSVKDMQFTCKNNCGNLKFAFQVGGSKTNVRVFDAKVYTLDSTSGNSRKSLSSKTTKKLSKTLELKPSDNLEAKLRNVKGGTVVFLRGGEYRNGIRVNGVKATQANPIHIRPLENAKVTFKGNFQVKDSSYVVLEGIKFTDSSGEGVGVRTSNHIIFIDCEIERSGYAGLKIIGRYSQSGFKSHHIDWIGGRIAGTGTAQKGAYGEAIYLGQAQQADDYSHDIWIEGATIESTKGAEGIDVKPEVYNITLKDNIIRKINPKVFRGNPTQTNDGAIAVFSGRKDNQKGTDRFGNIWIVGNKISNITSNVDSRGNGIAIANNRGIIAMNNQITNVNGWGIRQFTYKVNAGNMYKSWFVNNKISNAAKGNYSVFNGQSQVEIGSRSSIPSAILNKRPQKQKWWPYTSKSGIVHNQ